jgi:hypothetical protein
LDEPATGSILEHDAARAKFAGSVTLGYVQTGARRLPDHGPAM